MGDEASFVFSQNFVVDDYGMSRFLITEKSREF